MLDAVARAGSDQGPAIRDALNAANLQAVTGQIRFDPQRNPMKSAVVLGVAQGRFVYRATVNR